MKNYWKKLIRSVLFLEKKPSIDAEIFHITLKKRVQADPGLMWYAMVTGPIETCILDRLDTFSWTTEVEPEVFTQEKYDELKSKYKHQKGFLYMLGKFIGKEVLVYVRQLPDKLNRQMYMVVNFGTYQVGITAKEKK